LGSVGGSGIAIREDLSLRFNSGLYGDTTSSNGLTIGTNRVDTPIIFKTSPVTSSVHVEHMRITGAGFVGIGTTTPTNALNKLEVVDVGTTGVTGKLEFRNENSAYTYIKLTSDSVGLSLASHTGGGGYVSATGAVNITANDPANPTTVWLGNGSKFRIGNSAGTEEYFRVVTNGYIGIGTTNPTQKLHVSGSIRIEDIIYDSSNSPGTAGQVLYKPTNDTIGWTNKDSITSIPTSVTATPGGTSSLASNIDFVYFTWSGGSGTFNLNLPIASTHAYKIIRFVCDSTISANDKIHIQGSLGDTVDGGLFYALNKPYNGVQVWSDGSEWIVIQAKAT
jgi:hypothetical protein